MKRERDICDLFETLNLGNKRLKQIIQTEVHKDIFNIGKIKLENKLYTKNEVIVLLNDREDSLFDKFKKIMFSCIPKFDASSIIPRYVKGLGFRV